MECGLLQIYILIITKTFRYLNAGTEPYKAISGVGVPLHKPYIQLMYIGEYLSFRYLKSLVK